MAGAPVSTGQDDGGDTGRKQSTAQPPADVNTAIDARVAELLAQAPEITDEQRAAVVRIFLGATERTSSTDAA